MATCFVLSMVICIAFLNGEKVTLDGHKYDKADLSAFITQYEATIKKDLPSFKILSSEEEDTFRKEAFTAHKKEFEDAAAAAETTTSEKVLPSFNPENYVIVNVGTANTKVTIVKAGEVSVIPSSKLGEIAKYNVKNPKETTEFARALKDLLTSEYGEAAAGKIYVFVKGSFGFAVEEAVTFAVEEVHLQALSSTDPAVKCAHDLMKAWEAGRFPLVIKRARIKPQIQDGWSHTPAKKGVIDISGNSITAYKPDGTKEKMADEAPNRPNDILKSRFLDLIGKKGVKPEEGAKNAAHAILVAVKAVAKKATLGAGLKLDGVIIRQTGLVQNMRNEVHPESAAKSLEDNYYDERYYEEENERYNDQRDEYQDEQAYDDGEEYDEDGDYDEDEGYDTHDIGVFRAGYVKGYLAAAKELKKEWKSYAKAGQRLRNQYYY